MQVVEACNHFFDGGFIDVDALNGVLRGDGGDELWCRDFRRVERELERAFGTRPDRDARHLDLGRGTGKVYVEPSFGENAGAQALERSVGEQASLADDDDP